MSGPGSVIDIANQLINKKISVTIVRKQRDEFSEKLEAMKNRAERTKQVLDGELHKRQQMRRDFETIKVWITKIEVLITTRINKYEDIDEREIKVRIARRFVDHFTRLWRQHYECDTKIVL